MSDLPSSDVRQLRRVDLHVGETGFGDPDDPQRVAAVVDVETTGLDLESDKVIELAVRRFRYRPLQLRDHHLAKKHFSPAAPEAR